MTPVDLEPAAQRMAALVRAAPDDLLDRPTPCPAYTVADLLDHIGGLTVAFKAAATKELGGVTSDAPPADGSRLAAGWRDRIAGDLDDLVRAWREPAAWTGMTQAGGVDLPGEVAGSVALEELVVHGWDLARSLGRPFQVDDASLQVVHGFVSQIDPGDRDGTLFGPAVEVPADAPLLDRALGLAGRDPAWQPS